MNDTLSPATSATNAANTANAAPEAKKRPERPKSSRRRSREFALQGLYEWLVTRSETSVISAHMREQDDFGKCDAAHFDALLEGCIAQAPELEALMRRHIDRRLQDLSPVEHGVLLIGLFELQNFVAIPYRVAINEAVELAKAFGGTDGHKYVNGVLDRTAADLRPEEVQAQRQQRGG
ncbi:MAG: transcription antitermination factor NusB [Leptothrix ochracea]|uniref:transcription antitermination factor NusB n=1 Tax=Leptothrix ochracea TaxID=735331 RepID=UPI0034E1D43F